MGSPVISSLLAVINRGKWHPGIGDPTVMGWITVGAYFIGSLVCWRAASVTRQRAQIEVHRQLWIFWTVFAVLLLFLGLNKQLDLQTWLTQFGRQLAKNEGWFEYRRPVQAFFVLLVAMAGLAALVLLSWLTRRTRTHTWIALTGGIFLGSFILVRAASFHHVDTLLRTSFRGLKINWVLELSGIFWITLGAWLNLRRLKSEAGALRTPSQTSTPPQS
jgi:hypothetical protein